MKNQILAASLLLGTVFGVNAQTPTKKYIVKLKKGMQPESVSFFTQESVEEVKDLKVSFGQFYSVKSTALSDKNLSLLATDPAIEYIEENQVFTVEPIAENVEIQDANFGDQWGFKNNGRNSGGWLSRGKAGEDINAEEAWKISTGNKEVKIAVIDTGVDYNHKDLKANMWVNEAELNGQEGVDDDGNGYVDDVYGYDFANDDGDPMDGHGHGTHCAGNIGAVHNRSGVRGVMNNVTMVAIKFLSDSGRGETEAAIKSVDYAIKVGVNVMSNSWGGGEFSQALMDSIKAADTAGITFVAAAGNSRADNDARPTYPANYEVDNVITVGSHDGKGRRSSFSNYGKETVHIFAPGSNIMSTVPGDRYSKMSGTSMACPIAAGAIGLLVAENPGMTPKEIRERVIATAVDNGELGQYTPVGRLDAYRLLDNIQN